MTAEGIYSTATIPYVMVRRIQFSILFSPDEAAEIDNARGRTSFSEYVRDAAMEKVGQKK